MDTAVAAVETRTGSVLYLYGTVKSAGENQSRSSFYRANLSDLVTGCKYLTRPSRYLHKKNDKI